MESKLVVRVLMALTTMSILVTLLTIQQPSWFVRALIVVVTLLLIFAATLVVRNLPLIDGSIMWLTDRRLRKNHESFVLSCQRGEAVTEDLRHVKANTAHISLKVPSGINIYRGYGATVAVEGPTGFFLCYAMKEGDYRLNAEFPASFDGGPPLP